MVGIKEGIKQGIKQGCKEKQIEIAKNLKSNKIDINIIADVTGLTVSEVEKIWISFVKMVYIWT